MNFLQYLWNSRTDDESGDINTKFYYGNVCNKLLHTNALT